MTVDCSECHDLDLVDQEHAVGGQNTLASSCITTMMITKGLRRRFWHPACFQPKGSILPARRKSRSSLYDLSWRRFNVNVEVVTHEQPMVWRAPRVFFVRLHFQPLIALRALT